MRPVPSGKRGREALFATPTCFSCMAPPRSRGPELTAPPSLSPHIPSHRPSPLARVVALLAALGWLPAPVLPPDRRSGAAPPSLWLPLSHPSLPSLPHNPTTHHQRADIRPPPPPPPRLGTPHFMQPPSSLWAGPDVSDRPANCVPPRDASGLPTATTTSSTTAVAPPPPLRPPAAAAYKPPAQLLPRRAALLGSSFPPPPPARLACRR